jgi:KDO2-lipid IV(A) lauroyltransferase
MLKPFFFKLAFLYPRVYAFFSFYRKKERRREFEQKVDLLYEGKILSGERRRIVRGIFELRGARKIQRYVIPAMDREFIDRFVTVEGIGHLEEALKTKRGILLMACHLGNPHMGFNALRAMGYAVTVVKGGAPKRLMFPRFRYSDPEEYTIFTHDTSLTDRSRARMLEILQSGRILYYSADATGGHRRVEIPFIGRMMRFTTGTLYLAIQTDAVILPFVHLYRHGSLRLLFHPPINRPWSYGKEDYEHILTMFSRLFESAIRSHPEEYMGMYGPTVFDEYCRLHACGENAGKAGMRDIEQQDCPRVPTDPSSQRHRTA